MSPLRERDIERRLVERVKELGGEVRKVRWVGRDGAPDRLVMIPGYTKLDDNEDPDDYGWVTVPTPARSFWVEVKRPGVAATFPANAHERKQFREHERMRRMGGQRVEVVDSFERIEEILV